MLGAGLDGGGVGEFYWLDPDARRVRPQRAGADLCKARGRGWD